MKYGYVRDRYGVERNLDKQREVLGEVDVIIVDTDKTKLRDLVMNIKQGDSIHVSDMSRITRKREECANLYKYLSSKGANLYVNGMEYKPLSDFMENIMREVN